MKTIDKAVRKGSRQNEKRSETAVSKDQLARVSEQELDQWCIVVDSIGTAGAGMVGALKAALPIPERHLAKVLFQTPSVLVAGLAREVAVQANDLLQQAGLETRVVAGDEQIEPGDSAHEIALVIRDVSRTTEVLSEIIKLMGVKPDEARAILCKSPAILIGQVSARTVEACRRRFEPLGVELDVTRPAEATYDVVVGNCSRAERARILSMLRRLGFPTDNETDALVVQLGLDKEQAERVWERFSRTSLPLRIISRDFARFDVTLDAAPNSPEMIEYLVSSTGMPRAVAEKLVDKTPIVIHQLIGFEQMTACIEAVSKLGGSATGHLVVFQSFDLRIRRVGDRRNSVELLRLLTDYDAQGAAAALQELKIAGPLSHLHARWLQWELRQVGTETDRVLR